MLGELMLMLVISNAELLALAWSSIALTSILLPTLAAKEHGNIDTGHLRLIALMTAITANALPGIALGQVYYTTLIHSGPGNLIARFFSAIVILFMIMLLKVNVIDNIINNDESKKMLLVTTIIFMLIIVALTPAHILEAMTWLIIAAITVMIIKTTLESLRNT